MSWSSPTVEWMKGGERVSTEIGRSIRREKMSERRRRRAKESTLTVPFALRFGHYDLAGIRLTALVDLYLPFQNCRSLLYTYFS